MRLRYLTGPKGEHHGLRPIRVRLVAYLVAPLKARALAPEVAAALTALAPLAGGGASGGGSSALTRAAPLASTSSSAAEQEGPEGREGGAEKDRASKRSRGD